MEDTTRRRFVGCSAVATTFALAGCSGDTDPEKTGSATDTGKTGSATDARMTYPSVGDRNRDALLPAEEIAGSWTRERTRVPETRSEQFDGQAAGIYVGGEEKAINIQIADFKRLGDAKDVDIRPDQGDVRNYEFADDSFGFVNESKQAIVYARTGTVSLRVVSSVDLDATRKVCRKQVARAVTVYSRPVVTETTTGDRSTRTGTQADPESPERTPTGTEEGTGERGQTATETQEETATPESTDTNDGLEARFPFEGSGANTRGDNDGRFSGATGFTRTAKQGRQAATFAGTNGYFQYPRIDLQESGAYTLTSHVYTGSDLGGIQAFHTHRDGALIQCRIDDGTMTFFHNDGRSRTVGSMPVGTEEWHHTAITWDGTVARAYVDGREVGTYRTSTLSDDQQTGNYVGVGEYPVQKKFYYEGYVDDVRVYSVSKTESEISRIESGEL